MEFLIVMFGGWGALLIALFTFFFVAGTGIWIAAVIATEYFPNSKAAYFFANIDLDLPEHENTLEAYENHLIIAWGIKSALIMAYMVGFIWIMN